MPLTVLPKAPRIIHHNSQNLLEEANLRTTLTTSNQLQTPGESNRTRPVSRKPNLAVLPDGPLEPAKSSLRSFNRQTGAQTQPATPLMRVRKPLSLRPTVLSSILLPPHQSSSIRPTGSTLPTSTQAPLSTRPATRCTGAPCLRQNPRLAPPSLLRAPSATTHLTMRRAGTPPQPINTLSPSIRLHSAS